MPAEASAPGPIVTLSGSEARAALPEGAAAALPVSELFDLARPQRLDTRDLIVPDGVKCLLPTPRGFVLVHQTPPSPHRFRWIENGSPAEYGPDATYRPVRLALPYVITLARFEGTRGSLPHLSQRNECFFTQPSRSRSVGIDTPLSFPGASQLLARFPDDGSPAALLDLHAAPVAAGATRGRSRRSNDVAAATGMRRPPAPPAGDAVSTAARSSTS